MSTKNLAAQKQASAKRLKALAGIQTTIKNLSTSLVSTSKNVKLVAAQGEVRTRLSGLMRAGKLTPAEAKNIDIKKLAALPKEAREVSLSVLDAMEPKVPAGQRGTSDAIDFSQMGKEMKNKEIKNLKAEIRGDIRKLSGKSLKEESEEEKSYKKEMAADPFEKKEKEHESKKEMSGDDMHKCMSEMKSHLEKGDAKAALACHEKMSKHMSSEEHDEKKMSEGMDGMMAQENPEEQASANSEMQGQIDELNTNMARIAGMVQELMEVEKSEGEAMEKTGEEHQELKHGDSEEEHELEGEEDDEEMAEGEEESEDKKKLAEDKSKADEKEKAKLKKEMKKK